MPQAVAADGTRIAYDAAGSGPLLLFVHGITENRSVWDPVVERLQVDFTCARLDVRGHGDSDAPGDYDALTMAGDLAAATDAVGATDEPVIVGHSFGAFLATVYAAGGAGPVRGVVNVDQGLRMSDFAQLVRPLEAALRGPQFRETFGAIIDSLGPELLDPDTQARLARLHEDASQDLVVGIWRQLFESTDEEIDALVETMLLPNLRVPYLALHGSEPGDDYRDWLTRLVPTATVEVWDGDGHWLHLVEPDRFAARVRDFVAKI